eukprot:CAMPEP_0171483476 /NCGR_PEP_ID=MMETSP0946-20130122/8196_1 /TAXON_ID=109269 /ORGANISM="Vaucheria litorea, Strain CCMP2940" /LENGTH=277 /DNA_ID=CAMNT_0012015911 /DNA_START=29 /DNA_END=859 /DNA_ORIENTATION=-
MELPNSLSEMPPHYLGMLAGVIVFCSTVTVVIFLLVKGGSIKRMMEQTKTYDEAGPEALKQTLMPRLLLYDELIEASKHLPVCPQMPKNKSTLKGKFVKLREYNEKIDCERLFKISNGSPTLGLAYDPTSLWNNSLGENPPKSENDFKATKMMKTEENGRKLVVADVELGKVIGFVSLVDNSPKNLTVKIGYLWIAPNHGKENGERVRAAQETLFMLLKHLFSLKYRRVGWEMDSKDQNFSVPQSSGFLLEGILRKNRVMLNSNSDTAVLSVTNSDW